MNRGRSSILAALSALALATGCPGPSAPPSGAPTLLLVRHGESWKNLTPPPASMTSEQQDALTPRGKEQIAAVASALRGRDVKAIFTSPLGRTRESAAILGAALGKVPVVDEALATFKEGEKPDRVFAFLEAKRALGTIVVVTHGDVIAAVTSKDVATGSLTEVAQAMR